MNIPMMSAAFLSIENWVELLEAQKELQSRGLKTPAYDLLETLITLLTNSHDGSPKTYDDIESISYTSLEHLNSQASEMCCRLVKVLRHPDPYSTSQPKRTQVQLAIIPYYKAWSLIRRTTRALIYMKEAW